MTIGISARDFGPIGELALARTGSVLNLYAEELKAELQRLFQNSLRRLERWGAPSARRLEAAVASDGAGWKVRRESKDGRSHTEVVEAPGSRQVTALVDYLRKRFESHLAKYPA